MQTKGITFTIILTYLVDTHKIVMTIIKEYKNKNYFYFLNNVFKFL